MGTEGKWGEGLEREGKGRLLKKTLLFISADAGVRKFQPRSQGSLLSAPTERERETGRRENLGTRLRKFLID